MMIFVRDLPTEIRDKQSTMNNQAYSIVNNAIVREGLMSALMCEDPQSKPDYSLADPVDWPEDI